MTDGSADRSVGAYLALASVVGKSGCAFLVSRLVDSSRHFLYLRKIEVGLLDQVWNKQWTQGCLENFASVRS